MTTVGDWLEALDERFPPSWAEDWDSVGLQAGDGGQTADRVLCALDPTSAVIQEAARRECGLLVTHHPLVFRPLRSLDLAQPVAKHAAVALRSGIAVAACHTNADVASPGVSDALAEAIGVEVTGVLSETGAGERVKLVTFSPSDATGKILDALAAAGAGVIGEYTHCSFRIRGTGTFLPSERATPAVGERGELNEVEEDRLEIVLPRERLGPAVAALVQAHPYEEVAYDVYPLLSGGLGLGRVGRLDEALVAAELARRCSDRLGNEVRLVGDPDRRIETVAVCGGSGASLIPDALRARADAYVTGDVKHHEALDAAEAGLVVIDAGHQGTERPWIPRLAEILRESGLGEVLVSEIDTNPFSRP